MSVPSQHSAERINPFHFHPMQFFKHQGSVIQFKAEWKLVFSYLSSLQNKYGCIYVNTDALDSQLGLGIDIVLSAECIIRDFKALGIITVHKHEFRKDYMLLHAIELESCEIPHHLQISTMSQLFPSALSQREYDKSFDWSAHFPLFKREVEESE